ncbi:mucin-5AC [Melanotaenia boesemani]|uniref:mucin-5AC n=1 Tax=Melanotaenia boesemani TaxID=1250792 RepID=UPI001C03F209|nr:mucin-5AC [Melanotaenia boesemani]
MAVAYGTVTQSGLLSQQFPPPLLPKPGKDNVRLQKLLKRTAKKKASAQTAQSATPFRSSLSPVNEASPDLEHSDHFTPPRTPETQLTLYGIQQPPRFTVRPLYQHVASPYPQRAAYSRAARLSPQTVAMPSYSYSQHITTVSSYSALANISGVSASMGQATEGTVHESKKPPYNTFTDTHVGLRPASAAATTHSKPTSPGPTPYPVPGSQALIRPLTVLTPLVKSRSPRPTFKATEPSKSPKPMFDVPKIRMYTASTSYYETSRTPPVYDTAGLTAIGSTAPQSKTSMETKQDLTPASEFRRSTTTAAQPTSMGTDSQRQTPTTENKRGVTPTGEINTIRTDTSEGKGATPSSEIKRATPTSEIKRATPTSEIKRATPTSEIKRATPTSEIKRATPSSEMKRATPTAEERVKTPTYEFQTSKTFAGRPKTPAYLKARATTPVFEISRPNPLLFAVSPITVETERSRTSQTILTTSTSSICQTVKTAELPESLPNGDIDSDITPTVKAVQQSITKSKSEPDLRAKSPTIPAGSQRPKTPTSVLSTSEVAGYQRPKTPTYEASRLMTISPGYKRPKTPTYGASVSSVSHLAFQRPRTPVSQKSKSAYRGLTPAEYAAYGGIKTYSPAFGISSSTMPTKEELKDEKEVPVEQSQQPSTKEEATMEVSKVRETPEDVDKLHKEHEKVASTPSVPVIVVSQASDSPGTMLPQETSLVSAPKQETTVAPKPPATVGKISEKQEMEKQMQETKPKTPETKNSLPKGGDKDPLKAVKKLLGKDKVQTAKEKTPNEIKADVSVQNEPIKPDNKLKPKGSKPGPAAPALPVKVHAAESRTKDTEKVKKAETSSADKAPSSLENKEADENLKAAETLLKVMQKPKGMKTKTSGWSRLKKHMVVEQEEPKFPETAPQKEISGQDQSEEKIIQEKPEDKSSTQEENQTKEAPKATKMWDAVLFQMFSSKENIMHQIEINKSEKEKKDETKDELKEIPSFAYRLPVLLFSPRFDAKKLKEAASRPVTKISTVFEMGLIGRKGKDEEPKDFNRTARGFAAT